MHMRAKVGASCATSVLLGLAVGGCALGDDGAVSSPSEAAVASSGGGESPGEEVDPWTLPIEQRPELFDPCTEISAADLEAAGIESPRVRPDAEVHQATPPLDQCGWESTTSHINLSTIWNHPSEIATDASEAVTQVQNVGSYRAFDISPKNTNSSFRCGLGVITVAGLFTIDIVDLSENPDRTRACSNARTLMENLSSKLPSEALDG